MQIQVNAENVTINQRSIQACHRALFFFKIYSTWGPTFPMDLYMKDPLLKRNLLYCE
jgi:hypothetical protein